METPAHAPRPKPGRVRRWLWAAARILLLAYAGACLLLYLGQEWLIYHPTREIVATPASLGLAYEDVALRTSDGVRLAAWYVPAEGAGGTVLFCHGNARNMSTRLSSIAIFHRLGLGVLIFDYRGYGRSEGRPSEEGTYRDAEAAWNHLVADRGTPPGQIILFGRSLGGAVAAHLAERHRPRALILESTFTSAPDLGRELLPVFPVRWLARVEYDTLSRVKHLACPKLFIHSPEDDLVPFEHGRRLFEAAAEPKTFLLIHGPHNDGFARSGEAYVEGLRAFLAGLDAGEVSP